MNILSIDIGGTGVKAAVVDPAGTLLSNRLRVPTPHPITIGRLIDTIVELVKPLGGYDRIAVGFPGVVRGGKVLTAPSLGTERLRGPGLVDGLVGRFAMPVRIINDADMQGMAAIVGHGVEMVMTLGTGCGTSLFSDGHLAPHLELAHHRFRKGETYDEQLGNAARKKIGNKKWNRRVHHAIDALRTLTNFDRLYIGGGNAKHVHLHGAENVELITNDRGIAGGAWLWRDEEAPASPRASK